MESKKCKKCGCVKPLYEFGKEPRNKSGMLSNCKRCELDRLLIWRKANRQRINDLQKIRRKNNTGKYRLQELEYRDKNRNKINELAKNYYHAHHDKCVKRARDYRLNNKDKYIAYSLKYKKANREKIRIRGKIKNGYDRFNLADWYVLNVLKIKKEDSNNLLIELKRAQLKLYRATK